MSLNKFIRTMLKMTELAVVSVDLDISEDTLNINAKPYKNGCLCPTCKRRGKIIHKGEARKWRELPFYGLTVYLWYAPREINCPIHGRTQEMIPWAERYSQHTYRFEYGCVLYCKMMTQKSAASLLGIATSTLSDLLHRIIHRVRDGHKIQDIKIIGIDEVSYKKGKKFVTLVYDIKRACVVWVGKGKGRETIDKFFKKMLTDRQKKKIKYGTCDMSQAYIGAIEAHCPNAKLILDRFHLAKALNEAVDEVRKEEWREADADTRKALKGLRWLLYKHPSKRTKRDTRVLNSLRKSNRRIHRAWILKDEFNRFWDYNAPWAAERFLKRWGTTALKSRIEPIRKFVKTVRKHQHRILPYIGTGITNAIGEGINRVVKIVKNRASGFRELYAFIDMIYLTVGDVDIPGAFPENFRVM